MFYRVLGVDGSDGAASIWTKSRMAAILNKKSELMLMRRATASV